MKETLKRRVFSANFMLFSGHNGALAVSSSHGHPLLLPTHIWGVVSETPSLPTSACPCMAKCSTGTFTDSLKLSLSVSIAVLFFCRSFIHLLIHERKLFRQFGVRHVNSSHIKKGGIAQGGREENPISHTNPSKHEIDDEAAWNYKKIQILKRTQKSEELCE